MSRQAPEVVHAPRAEPHRETAGPAPTGTLVVLAVLTLTVIGLWMLVLGIQLGRN